MKRSRDRWLGLGTALMALALVGAGQVVAQEDDRDAPRARAFSILGGSGGYLGVGIVEVDGELADEAGMSREYGVYIESVSEGGPAEDAGLAEGDVIVGWNGDRVESLAQLQRLTRETPPGRMVDLTVMRNGSERDFAVELGDRSSANVFTLPSGGNLQFRTAPRGDGEFRTRIAPEIQRRLVRPDMPEGRSFVFSRRARLGASIQSLGDQLADYFGVDGGALVTAVNEDSPAEAAGLQAGDVIVRFDGESIEDPGDLLEALRDQDAGEASMTVVRDGSERTLTVELEEVDGDWDGDDVSLYWGEGGNIAIAPFEMESFNVGPMEIEGFELEPMEFEFDMGEYFHDGEPLRIEIPQMDWEGFEIPMIEIPQIEIPGFDMSIPRIEIRV